MWPLNNNAFSMTETNGALIPKVFLNHLNVDTQKQNQIFKESIKRKNLCNLQSK